MFKFDLKKIKYFKKNSRTEKPRAVLGIFFGLAVMLAGAGYIGAKNGWFGGVPERTAILLLLAIGVGLMLIVAISKRKSFSFGTAPKNPNRIAKLAIIAVIIFTLGVGGTFALNGFFGGGEAVPEDTFSRGLVGYWSFDEGKGNIAYDASGNGNTGALVNGPKWVNGKGSGALQFDGKDDYVDLGSGGSMKPVTDITIEIWVNPAAKQNIYADIFGNHLGGGYVIQQNGANLNQYYFTYYNGASYQGTGISTQLVANKWNHFVVQKTGNLIKHYLNGKMVASGSVSGDISYAADQHMWVGNGYTGFSRVFSGVIDEARVYNRALSEAEIQYHYGHGGPVGYWKFDEGSGATAKDYSGNNNDGMISGAVWNDGKYGSGLDFDGSDSVNAGTDPGLALTQAMSLQFWIKKNSSEHQMFFVDKHNNGANGYFGYFSIANKIYFRFGNNIVETADNAFTDGLWNHIAITGDATSERIYVNGTLIKNQTGSYSWSSASDAIIIGNTSADEGAVHGAIDEFKIYDYVRSADEIRLDYQAGMAAFLGSSGKTCSEDPASCMDKDLKGYWPMDEGKGFIVYDASGSGNNGSFIGNPKWVDGGRSAGSKNALNFDGVDDGVSGANITLNDNSTYEYWYFTNSAHLSKHAEIVSIGLDKFSSYFRNGSVLGRFYDGSAYSIASTPIIYGKWTHIVVVAKPTVLELYENGALKYSAMSTYGHGTDTGPLRIGRHSYEYVNGLIDEVKVYNRALSAEEIRYHYNQGNPAGYWNFDDGSGVKAADFSGNNNDGAITGAAWVDGKYGSALIFDGVDDHINISNSSILEINGDITLSAWVYWKGGEAYLFSKGSGNDYTQEFEPLIEPSGEVRFIVGNSGGTGYGMFYSSGYMLLPNTWYYLTFAINGSNGFVYVNGLKRGAGGTITSRQNNNDYVRISGRQEGPDRYCLNGLMDDVKIYNYARTDEQIRQDYQAGMANYFGPSGKTCSEDPASCMDKGLMGYWSMDEGNGGVISDKSSNNNSGRFMNGVKWAEGKQGMAANFDGINDFARIEATPMLTPGTGSFSVEMWVRRVGESSSSAHLASVYQGDYNRWVMYAPNGIVYLAMHDTEGNPVNSPSYNLPDYKWHHIIAVRDKAAGKVYLYADGRSIGTPTIDITNNVSPNSILTIGAYKGAYAGFGGLIDEMRIYNRALSAEEVGYHYNQGEPVAHWDMDEGEGSVVGDQTGNHNRGTLINGPTWAAGKYGSALNFDGINDYISVADSTVFNSTSVTVSAWVKVDDWSIPNLLRGIVSYRYPDGTPSGYLLDIVADNGFGFATSRGTSGDFSAVSTGYSTGIWYYVSGIYNYNDSTVKLYVDGDLKKTSTMAGPISYNDYPANMQFRIGYDYANSGRYFDGQIDNVRIYDYARTANQIKTDYQQGVATHLK